MSGLLYYLPGEDPQRPLAVTLQRVGELGLGYAFERRPTPSGVHRDGPDGGRGVIVADGSRVQKIGYYPDRQRWRRMPAQKAWVGLYHDAMPLPEDLARAELLGGRRLTLADGRDWIIPLARAWNDSLESAGWYHALPRQNDLDDAGRWVAGDVLPRYQRLWTVATGWWDAKHAAIAAAVAEGTGDRGQGTGEETVRAEFDFDDFGGLNDAAAYVLGMNYRVGRAEIALLGLLDTSTASRILDAAVDWDVFMGWIEKKTAAGSPPADSSTAAGPPAETPVIAQP